MYIKGGWQMDVPGPNLGRFAVSVDYGDADDIDLTDDEFTTWGIAVTQKVAKLGAEFYFAYRNHDLDRDGSDFNDIDSAILGARIKF